MEHAAHRPMLALATLTTAGALALTPITVTPHVPSISPARVSTQAVQLTDVWSDLATDTVASVIGLAAMFLGRDNNFPLPSPTIPLAPVATQLVLNQFIYAAQLLTGNGGQIPGEIATHLNAVLSIAGEIIGAVPGLLGMQLRLPFVAAQTAINYVINSGNLLVGLIEAPAVFLNIVLNNQYGLLGQVGPIGFPIIVRNVLAKSLYTTPPAIVLPFKKAASTPKSAAETVKAAAPSGTASSARSKPKAPSSAAPSKRTTASATANNNSSAGQGHSKRG